MRRERIKFYDADYGASEGTTPSLTLAYSSAASNGRTSPRAPAENTGEGWTLTMGSISEEKEAGGSIWYFLNKYDVAVEVPLE